MTSENHILSLVRQYVRDSQDRQRQGDASAVIQLVQDRATSLATLEKHFNTFTGNDRFWLYTLAEYLLDSDEARCRFYAIRLPLEDDLAYRKLILARQRITR